MVPYLCLAKGYLPEAIELFHYRAIVHCATVCTGSPLGYVQERPVGLTVRALNRPIQDPRLSFHNQGAIGPDLSPLESTA